jgi:hypothetical protein
MKHRLWQGRQSLKRPITTCLNTVTRWPNESQQRTQPRVEHIALLPSSSESMCSTRWPQAVKRLVRCAQPLEANREEV